LRALPSRKPSALILAAGASTRFGTPKQLAKLWRKTLLQRAIASVPASSVRETVVVIGHAASAVRESIDGEPVKVVVNQDYRAGLSSSIRKGVASLSPDTPGVLLLLADQPLVTKTLLRGMLELFAKKDAILAASAGGVASPPVIFPRRYFDELQALSGDKGAKEVIERHRGELLRVPAAPKKTLADIDTQDDIRAARKG